MTTQERNSKSVRFTIMSINKEFLKSAGIALQHEWVAMHAPFES